MAVARKHKPAARRGAGASPGLDPRAAGELAQVFKALADPTRLRLIAALLDGERCVHELTEALEMAQSAVSHQLRTLRHLRLVRFRKQGRHVYYALDDSHVRRLYGFALEHVAHAAPEDRSSGG